MTGTGVMALPPEAIWLLEPALGYALTVMAGITPELAVTPEFLARPTPCRGWNLRMLLLHASESLDAIHEGIDAGRIGLGPASCDTDPASTGADPAGAFRQRASRLLDACAGRGPQQASRRPEVIRISDRLMTAGALASAGAIEIAVHGWDVSRACGPGQQIPRELAADLLAIAPLLVPSPRHPLFAAPVTVAPQAGASDRLTAFLGRAGVA